ncbi:RNA-binding protein 48 isoform 1-T1 [Mantella aurantiaca]
MSVGGRSLGRKMAARDPRLHQEVQPHHQQRKVCASRAKYREGRKPRAVKVYTINLESRYLLVQGVPAIGVMQELVQQFALYGAIEEYNVLDEYPAEEFTEVYLIKFQRLHSARIAKRKQDERSFFGGILHVCYAPEYESVQETREKLQERRRYVMRVTSDKDHQVAYKRREVSESSTITPAASAVTCAHTSSSYAHVQSGDPLDPTCAPPPPVTPDYRAQYHPPLHPSGYDSRNEFDHRDYRTERTISPAQGQPTHVGSTRFMPRMTFNAPPPSVTPDYRPEYHPQAQPSGSDGWAHNTEQMICPAQGQPSIASSARLMARTNFCIPPPSVTSDYRPEYHPPLHPSGSDSRSKPDDWAHHTERTIIPAQGQPSIASSARFMPRTTFNAPPPSVTPDYRPEYHPPLHPSVSDSRTKLDGSAHHTERTIIPAQGQPSIASSARFMPRTTQLQERQRRREERTRLALLPPESQEVVIGPKLPEIPKLDMADTSLNISADFIRGKLKEVSASSALTRCDPPAGDPLPAPPVKQRRRI